MDTNLEQAIAELGEALLEFKMQHPAEYAAAEAELTAHVEAINAILEKAA